MFRRNVIYQKLAWVPIAAGTATLAFAIPSSQIVSKTVIVEPDTSYTQAIVAAAETITADKWYSPLDLPMRERRRIADQQELAAPPSPAAGDATLAFTVTSGMVATKAIVYEPDAYTPFTPAAAETITIDKWWRQLELPPKVKRLSVTAGLSFIAAAPGSATAYNWDAAGEPLRLKRNFQQIADGYPPYQPPSGETVTIDKWWRQLELPVRRRQITAEEGSIFGSPPKPEANDQMGYYRPLDAPTRLKRLTLIHQPDARDAFPQPPRGFYPPLDIPTRARRGPTNQVGYSYIASASGAGVAYNWFVQLDEPLRIKRTPKTDLGFSNYLVPSLEVVTVDKWWKELVQPTRRTRPVPQQHGYTFVAAAPGAGAAYNWFSQLDLPVRARKSPKTELGYGNFTPPPRGLAATTTSGQVFRRSFFFDRVAYPPYFVPPTPGAGNEYNWFLPLGEPLRPRLSIRTAQQWPLTVPPRLLTTTLENGWWRQLDTPVRLKLTFGQYPAVVQGNIDVRVPLAWSLIDDPRRLKRIPYESNAQAIQYQITELITVDKWFAELGRPVRLKRIDYPAFATAQGNVNPIVPFAHTYLHAPHRLKGRLNYPALAQGNINPIVPFAHTYLFTPHRLKGRIDRPALAQQGALKPDTVQVGKFTQWWRQLDLPVREWRKIAWQWFHSMPPTGVAFFNEGGPADESERVVCVPFSSRTAVEPGLLRTATVPLEQRVATVPDLLRVAYVPDAERVVNSNDYRDGRQCHDT